MTEEKFVDKWCPVKFLVDGLQAFFKGKDASDIKIEFIEDVRKLIGEEKK